MRQINSVKGITLTELILVLLIFGILLSGGMLNFRELIRKDKSAAAQIVSFLNTVRGLAIAQTRYIVVKPTSSNSIATFSASSCLEDSQTLDRYSLALPTNAELLDQNWRICFNSKGLSNSSGSVRIREGSRVSRVEIALGGVARVAE